MNLPQKPLSQPKASSLMAEEGPPAPAHHCKPVNCPPRSERWAFCLASGSSAKRSDHPARLTG